VETTICAKCHPENVIVSFYISQHSTSSAYGQERDGAASHLSDDTSSLTKCPRHKESEYLHFSREGDGKVVMNGE
jgi:hypothetical protein